MWVKRNSPLLLISCSHPLLASSAHRSPSGALRDQSTSTSRAVGSEIFVCVRCNQVFEWFEVGGQLSLRSPPFFRFYFGRAYQPAAECDGPICNGELSASSAVRCTGDSSVPRCDRIAGRGRRELNATGNQPALGPSVSRVDGVHNADPCVRTSRATNFVRKTAETLQ